MNSKQKTIQLALIGAGKWGRNFIKTIAGMPQVDLAAIASNNPATKTLVPKNSIIVTDWKTLLNEKLDGVIIATPPEIHAEIAIAFIEKKIPIAIEKPLTLTLTDFNKIKKATTENNFNKILVDHIYLFHPAFKKLKEIIVNEKRQILAIESYGMNHGPFRDSYSGLWDYGPHDLAMCFDLLQSVPQTILAKTIEGNYQLDFTFPKEITAKIIVGNMAKEKQRKFIVHCKDGTLILDDVSSEKLKFCTNDKEYLINIENKSPLQCYLEEFIDGIQGNISKNFGLTLSQNIIETLAHCSALCGKP